MIQSNKLLEKMQGLLGEYQALRFKPLERQEQVLRADTRARHYRGEPNDLAYSPIHAGDVWGESGVTTWFVADVESSIPDTYISLDYSCADAGRFNDQVLVFQNDVPIGVLDRNHSHVRLSGCGKSRMALEAYPFHTVPGNQPHERGRFVGRNTRTFKALSLWQERPQVKDFVMDLRVLMDLHSMLSDNDLFKHEILCALQALFQLMDAMPDASDEARLLQQAAKGSELLKPLLDARNGSFAPSLGLTAHAHIDTAWQWDVEETVRKCARTFSSVLNLMRQYPDFSFVQSQPYQLERLKAYPALHAEISQRIAEGRWEINGGMYVEPDLNLPSGEALVRQLLYGQHSTQKEFGKVSDTLWMPDTFGFSAALPQLMLGAGVRHFSTGKLNGNDTSPFPYDVFRWQGIDGSEVLAHFSRIENTPGPKTTIRQWNDVKHKDSQRKLLNAFGHGDGGGGPTADMLEEAKRTVDLQGCPRSFFTTVSAFMQGIPQGPLPRYRGELYFQAHRGTLTSISEIKYLNRRLEYRFREAEFFCAMAALKGKAYPQEALDTLWKRFLVCQFHDILPGSAIEEVNTWAVQEMNGIHRELGDLMALPRPIDNLTLHNTLGSPCEGVLHIPLGDKMPLGVQVQPYTDLNGKSCAALAGFSLPPLAAQTLPLGGAVDTKAASPFKWAGDTLTTPHFTVAFAPDGSLTSMRTSYGMELVAGRFNQFQMGEDIPAAWENWDIDSDQQLKMQPAARLLSREVVSDGPVELRVRSAYDLGGHSTLHQDMVFYAQSPQVDFVTRLQWQGKRQLLKAVFDTALQADQAQHSIQFGYIARPTHGNEPSDRARFEVCCHEWSNLSQANQSLALLNDGKYGISVSGGTLGLTLIKSSVHPDTRGDAGTHSFTYALLPYEGGFDARKILPAAHLLNAPPTVSGLPAEEAPILQLSSPTISVEAVKMAQTENALVIRLLETAGGSASGILKTAFPIKAAFETDLLENRLRELDTDCIKIDMQPFQVRTVLLEI